MAFLVSIDGNSDTDWMTQNLIARWLNRLVVDRCGSNAALVRRFEISLAIGGLDLPALAESDAGLYREMVRCLREIARDVRDGRIMLCDDEGASRPDLQAKCEASFGVLFERLRRIQV